MVKSTKRFNGQSSWSNRPNVFMVKVHGQINRHKFLVNFDSSGERSQSISRERIFSPSQRHPKWGWHISTTRHGHKKLHCTAVRVHLHRPLTMGRQRRVHLDDRPHRRLTMGRQQSCRKQTRPAARQGRDQTGALGAPTSRYQAPMAAAAHQAPAPHASTSHHAPACDMKRQRETNCR